MSTTSKQVILIIAIIFVILIGIGFIITIRDENRVSNSFYSIEDRIDSSFDKFEQKMDKLEDDFEGKFEDDDWMYHSASVNPIDYDRFKLVKTKNIAVSGIEDIAIGSSSAIVRVESSDDDEVLVSLYTTKDNSDMGNFLIDSSSSRIKIEYNLNRRSYFFNWRLHNRDLIVVTIPKDYNNNLLIDIGSGDAYISSLKLKHFSADLSSGDLDIVDVSAKVFDSITSSGDVDIFNVKSDIANFKTSSGSVYASGFNSETVSVKVTSGSVKIDGSVDDIDIDISSGIATFIASEMPTKIKVRTTSGSSKILLPENDGFSVTQSHTSGKINVNFPLNNDGSRTVYKDGGNTTMDLSVSSGSITVSGN